MYINCVNSHVELFISNNYKTALMEEAICNVAPYTRQRFPYALDARWWSPSMLVRWLVKMGASSIAYRCYISGVRARDFLNFSDREFIKKYERPMRLNADLKRRAEVVAKSIQRNTAACILQRAIRAHLEAQEEKRYLYRGNVVKEFIQTEQFGSSNMTLSPHRTYFKQLEVVETLIHKPLMSESKGLLTAEQMRLLFGTLQAIYGVSAELLKRLREKASVFTPRTRFGSIIITLIPYLRVYSDYCRYYSKMNETVQELKPPHPFSAFYKLQMAKAPEEFSRFDITYFLITPIQRLPRYRLLLTDLLKHLRPRDVDYADVKKSLEEVERVTAFVNNQTAEQVNKEQLLQLSSILKGLPPDLLLFQPGRQFLGITPVLMEEEWVRTKVLGKTINESPKRLFVRQNLPESVLTEELFDNELPAELMIMTDILIVVKRVKTFLVGTVNLHYILDVRTELAAIKVNSPSATIFMNKNNIKLTFEDEPQKWLTLLKKVFEGSLRRYKTRMLSH